MRSIILLSLPIMLAATTHAQSPKAELPLEKRVYKDAAGKSLPYRLMKPEKYDAAKKYPLVLFLHGAGERGNDNDKQLIHGIPQFASAENRAKYPCFLIAPQCSSRRKWVEIDWTLDSHEMPEKPSRPLRQTLEAIAELQKEFSIDPDRLYVTGLSMGGYGTWDVICRHPEMFAAAVPICGGADERQAPRIAKLPIWTFHGALDKAVKPERSRKMIDALHKAGGLPGHTEYPDVGHNSWDLAYRDPEMYRWLFSKSRKK